MRFRFIPVTLAALLLATGLFWGCSSSESNMAKAEPQKISGIVKKVGYSTMPGLFTNSPIERVTIWFEDGRVKRLLGFPTEPIPTGQHVTILYHADTYGTEKLVDVLVEKQKPAAKKTTPTHS